MFKAVLSQTSAWSAVGSLTLSFPQRDDCTARRERDLGRRARYLPFLDQWTRAMPPRMSAAVRSDLKPGTGYIEEHSRDQILLLPATVDDHVAADNPAPLACQSAVRKRQL
ncbi:MAG: hypothetical protein P8Y48_11550 [Novosphingobium sp.]